MEEKRVEVSKGTVVYLEHGKGRQMLFLHGGIATPRAYIPLFELLGQHFHIIAPTHPGHGDSFKLPRNWKLEDFVRTYQEFLANLSLTPDVLVGHSFGGTLGLLLAVKGIGTSVIAMDPPGLPFAFGTTAYLEAKKKEAREILMHARSIGRIRKTLSAAGTLLYTAVRHPENIPWLTTYGPRWDLRRQFSAVRVPVTLLWGEDDGIVPPIVGKAMCKTIIGSRMVTFKNKGHNYPVTDWEFTYTALMDILGSG